MFSNILNTIRKLLNDKEEEKKSTPTTTDPETKNLLYKKSGQTQRAKAPVDTEKRRLIYDDILKPYLEFVKPFEPGFKLLNAIDGIIELIRILEKYGDYPSIQTKNHNLNVLARITIKEHSYRTARKIMELVRKNKSSVFSTDMPPFITVALGHDIGKIPIFHENNLYVIGDHPIIGARIIRRCLYNASSIWLQRVEEAILNHHRQSDNTLDIMLRRADNLSRMEELITL